MREAIWRKIDKIYMTKRRRALAWLYRGDPSDPANSERVLREEVLPPKEPNES